MGTWSTEHFGNDDASDWAYELERAEDLAPLEEALDAVIDFEDEYLEAPEGVIGVAAAAVIAALGGASVDDAGFTPAVQAWIVRIGKRPEPALVAKAVQALDRITGEDSELCELWAESDDFAAWQASMTSLRAQLAA
jgi:hypothetical protein